MSSLAPTPPSPAPPTSVPPEDATLLDLALALARGWQLLFLAPLLAAVTVYAATFALTPTYTAKASIIPPQQRGGMAAALLTQLGSLGGLAASAAGIKNPADHFIAILQSTTIADRIVERFGLMDRYATRYRQDARRELDRRTQIATGRDGLILIEVDDPYPEFAASIANAYVEELQRLLESLTLSEASQRRAFFEKQLAQTNERLARAQESLRAVGVDAATLKLSPQSAVELVSRLKAQVTAQELRLSSMRGYLAEGSPDLRQASAELAALRAQLARAETTEPAVPAGGRDYVTRFREFKYQETLFELFARQFELAKVDEANEGPRIQMVDRAAAPEKPSRPQKLLYAAIAWVGAFGLAAFVAIVRASLRTTAADPTGAAKLAAIRAAFGLRRRRGDR